jgi:hypothetical protein
MRRLSWISAFLAGTCWIGNVAAASPTVPAVSGWEIARPTAGTHQACTQLGEACEGQGCAKIVGSTGEHSARAAFMQQFVGKTALKPGRTYRYSVAYRTATPLDGYGQLLIDSYTRTGEKSYHGLVSQKLAPSSEWKTLSGEITVPDQVVRVRMLLYLHGKGTIYFDDAFFGDKTAGAKNLLANGRFEPPESSVFDLAPERRSGPVRLTAGFDGASLGRVKQLGPDEFYVYAFDDAKPHSSFMWFFFAVEHAQGRELTIRVNPAPFSRDKTGGNGTRSPVVSDDGDHWQGVADKQWNADGTVLTFKHRFTGPKTWVASFFPYTMEHIARWAKSQAGSPYFKAGTVGKSREGRDMPLFTITDNTVPEAQKRVLLFTTLQHDLETTGAMALEGICGFLLSTDPRAAALRREFVVYAVPMMDPDGIAAGNMYCPAGNMNRQWGLNTTPEVSNLERFAKSLAARGRKIELFMDFHGWCTPQRTTEFLHFGPELVGPDVARDQDRLADTIKPRLQGKVLNITWHKLTDYVGPGQTLERLSFAWMQRNAQVRLGYSIEIFGEGECTQDQYLAWGRAFAEGFAEFYKTSR